MVRAVVISGSLGAGKTRLGEEIHDVLSRRGLPCAAIDLDGLARVQPRPSHDRFNQRLMFANLAAIWPNYAAVGVEFVVLSRVIEDEGDRAEYRRSLGGAEVQIVRLEASSSTRRARLIAREPAGTLRDRHLVRTDELAGTLQELALDDFVVQNDGRAVSETAAEVIELLGW